MKRSKRCSAIVFAAFVSGAMAISCSSTNFTTGGSGGMGAGGQSNSGGSGSGGSSGGTPVDTACVVDNDCAAAVDMANPCFSASCSGPVPAALSSVQSEVCLVLWEDRNDARPEQCETDEPATCPASCAQPPTCITPFCSSGECQLDLGYTDAECETASDACADLDQARDDALQAARQCTVGSLQCNGEATVPDPCSCGVLVNEAEPEKVEQARQAYQAWAEQCDAPDFCAVVDCSPDAPAGSCEAVSVGLEGVCR